MIYIGVDPGKSGAIAFISDLGMGPPWAVKNSETLPDLADSLRDLEGELFAVIETVHSSPQMGVRSAFTFGQSFGQLEALLTAFRIPFERVRPQAWQKYMQCLSKGDKNVTKRKAQELFPTLTLKITHANADALLLAEYARRTYGGGK